MGVLNYHVVYKEIYSTHTYRQTDTHFGVVHNNKGLMGQINKILSKTLVYSIIVLPILVCTSGGHFQTEVPTLFVTLPVFQPLVC